MIKKIVSLACVVLSCMTLLRANDEVLLTIDGKPVYASEFEYIYTKNNASGQVEKQTVDEYLDLFVNFKLKVADACLEGLDTTQSFVAELTGYRNQLARPYLTDKAEEDRLMEEAYNRKLENVKIAHIAFKLPDNPTAADTLAAYTEAMTLRDKLIGKKKQKPLDFEKAALEYSDDPTVQENKGVLGWVSIFRFLWRQRVVRIYSTKRLSEELKKTTFCFLILRISLNLDICPIVKKPHGTLHQK